MNIIKFIKRLFKPINNFREALEDKLADILEKVDSSTKVDEVEKEAIAKAIKFTASYYGVKNVPAGVSDVISEEVVKCLGKINKKLQTQLRK